MTQDERRIANLKDAKEYARNAFYNLPKYDEALEIIEQVINSKITELTKESGE